MSDLRVLAILSPGDVTKLGGLPAEAIVGSFGPDGGFRPNPAFLEFLQKLINTQGRFDPDLIAAAEEQGAGSVAVIDFRTPEGIMGTVPPEDIIGAFAVEDGKLGEYFPSPLYRTHTENGTTQLPPPLAALHRRELMKLSVEEDCPQPKKGLLRTAWDKILGRGQEDEF